MNTINQSEGRVLTEVREEHHKDSDTAAWCYVIPLDKVTAAISNVRRGRILFYTVSYINCQLLQIEICIGKVLSSY